MSDFTQKTKEILTQCMKFIATCAKKVAVFVKRLAKEVKYKTGEWSDLGKRRELISELGERVHSLSRNGIELPNAVDVLIEQINLVEKNLDDRRTEHAAEKAAYAEQRAAEKAASAMQRAVKKAASTEQRVVAKKAASAEQRAAEEAARAAEEAAKSAAQVTMPADVPVEPVAPKAPTMEMPEEKADEAASDSEVPKLQL